MYVRVILWADYFHNAELQGFLYHMSQANSIYNSSIYKKAPSGYKKIFHRLPNADCRHINFDMTVILRMSIYHERKLIFYLISFFVNFEEYFNTKKYISVRKDFHSSLYKQNKQYKHQV